MIRPLVVHFNRPLTALPKMKIGVTQEEENAENFIMVNENDDNDAEWGIIHPEFGF